MYKRDVMNKKGYKKFLDFTKCVVVVVEFVACSVTVIFDLIET